MFRNKNKKINKQTADNESELMIKIDQDLLVHNMPDLGRSNKIRKDIETINAAQSNSGLVMQLDRPTSKHQKIGLLIISSGIILIGALIYISYLFIIKPSLSNDKQILGQVADNQILNIDKNNIAEQITIENSGIVMESDPIIIDLVIEEEIATTTELMAEELSNLEAIEWPPLVDTDNDGLYDNEEIVLGTDINNVDTNNNTFPDLLEIFNNYNPAGEGKLEDNSNLARYKDNFFDYELLYPKDWEFSVLSDNQVLVFNTPDDSIIQISIQENLNKDDIYDWYLNLFPDQLVSYDRMKIKNTWKGVESLDSLNVYLTGSSQKNIFTISYIPAASGRVAYTNIFKLMVDSLILF